MYNCLPQLVAIKFNYMEIFKFLLNEIVGFLGINAWIEMFKSGNYSSLRTYDGFLGAIGPLIPFLLLLEIARALLCFIQ